jgi:hypothetical protein
MTKITCSREVTNMQEGSKKFAGITCNSIICQDINMQKMTRFLDEKYTPANMKKMHAKRTNIFVKHAS